MTWNHICPTCGKRSYLTRHAARQAKRLHSDRRGLSVYRCSSGYWHIGHLPYLVRRGNATRGDLYGERETA